MFLIVFLFCVFSSVVEPKQCDYRTTCAEYMSGYDECPRPFNFIEDILIEFETNLVPKIELLADQSIYHLMVRNLTMAPPHCATELRSVSRAAATIGRIKYVANAITNSSRYKQMLSSFSTAQTPLHENVVNYIKADLQRMETLYHN